MGYFEGEISKAVVLALFIPLIISSGGNSGSQASSIIIRAMALGEIKFRSWWYVMRKEIFSGIRLGVHPWTGRIYAGFFSGSIFIFMIMGALVAGCFYGRIFPAWRCFMGYHFRFHVANHS